MIKIFEIQGLPLSPGKPILIPGTEETQPDVVSIRWERSSSNGGSAIIGYLVEHRKLGSPNWIRSTPILCKFPEVTLSGLEPGWRYQFRIRAQNALGLSEPSEISDPLTVTLQRAIASSPQFDLELIDIISLENDQVYINYYYFSYLITQKIIIIQKKIIKNNLLTIIFILFINNIYLHLAYTEN